MKMAQRSRLQCSPQIKTLRAREGMGKRGVSVPIRRSRSRPVGRALVDAAAITLALTVVAPATIETGVAKKEILAFSTRAGIGRALEAVRARPVHGAIGAAVATGKEATDDLAQGAGTLDAHARAPIWMPSACDRRAGLSVAAIEVVRRSLPSFRAGSLALPLFTDWDAVTRPAVPVVE
ncbi:MAG: hypothetical protein KIS78_20770 [Labilithrix sp.]|nr:hypothetical protein [Labilithrix sp.]